MTIEQLQIEIEKIKAEALRAFIMLENNNVEAAKIVLKQVIGVGE